MMRAVLGKDEDEKHTIFNDCTEKYQGIFEKEISNYNTIFESYHRNLIKGLNEYKENEEKGELK